MDRSINGVLEEQWFISRHSLYKLLNRNWCSVRVNYITRSPLECHTICKHKRHLTHRFQGQKSIDLRRRWLRSKAMYMNDLLFTTHFNLAHLRFKYVYYVALRKKNPEFSYKSTDLQLAREMSIFKYFALLKVGHHNFHWWIWGEFKSEHRSSKFVLRVKGILASPRSSEHASRVYQNLF